MDWNLTLDQKDQFLELLNKLGSHSVYPIDHIKEKLTACGVPVKINEIDNRLLVGTVLIELTEPEWGEAGIYPMNVLRAAINDHGFKDGISSNMSGRGFYFRDLLGQLALKWGIEKNYL